MAESIVIVIIAAMFLLGIVEVQSKVVSLSSFWREKHHGINTPCGGNLIRISTIPSPSDADTEQLQVECNGRDTRDPLSRFEVVTRTDGRQCIQFTSSNDTRYALKVINGNNTVFERQDCSTASGEFLFKQRSIRHRRIFYAYKHGVSGLYLTCLCDRRDGLYLIDVNLNKEGKDRRFRFIKKPVVELK